MTNITKIYGGPGTGKTTTLQKRLDDELKEYGIGDICFTTFSRKAKEVIFKRVRKAYPSIRKLEWFGTMHSICARLIGFNSENALTPEDKVEFCNKYHYEYEKVDLKNIDYEGDYFYLYEKQRLIGNQLFNMTQQARIRQQSIKEYYYDIKNQDSIGEGVTFEILKRFVKQYNEYKLENDKMDYTDMLEQVLKKRLIPNVKVLFVDEFQDFSRIQYLIYEMWRDACEKVYICGDDFQCIYEFNGADSSFFLNTYADHKIILPKTYRLPSNHLKLSNNLIQSVKHKQLKNITSVKDYKGIINYIDVEEQGMNKIMDMIKKDMKYYNNTCKECKHEYVSKVKQNCPLCNSKHIEREKLRISFLFRAKYQAIEFIEYLNELGIIFQGRFSFWDEETINIYNGLYKIKHNLKLNNAEIRDVLLLLPSTQFLIWGTKTELKDEETIEKDKIFIDIKKQHFSLQEKDCDLDRVIYALQLDNKIKKGLLRSLEKNVPIIKTPKDIPLIVETMHNFKGEESDINFVFLNITMKVEDGILNTSDGLDNEKRLFYVAITRQKRKLVLVDNFINNRSFLEYSNIKV